LPTIPTFFVRFDCGWWGGGGGWRGQRGFRRVLMREKGRKRAL
jgi:hypothetical protein